jgi:hypothetical protein
MFIHWFHFLTFTHCTTNLTHSHLLHCSCQVHISQIILMRECNWSLFYLLSILHWIILPLKLSVSLGFLYLSDSLIFNSISYSWFKISHLWSCTVDSFLIFISFPFSLTQYIQSRLYSYVISCIYNSFQVQTLTFIYAFLVLVF